MERTLKQAMQVLASQSETKITRGRDEARGVDHLIVDLEGLGIDLNKIQIPDKVLQKIEKIAEKVNPILRERYT